MRLTLDDEQREAVERMASELRGLVSTRATLELEKPFCLWNWPRRSALRRF